MGRRAEGATLFLKERRFASSIKRAALGGITIPSIPSRPAHFGTP